MDEGAPIAYQVLDEGVPVYSADEQLVGSVEHVIAAPAEDIFHGIVARTEGGQRFIAADQIASLHERGVDLRIDAAVAAELPESEHAAVARRLRQPGIKPHRWRNVLDLLEGKSPRRDWTDLD